MSRQCLYCAKELPKSSASNFCSKECWTEYKKLKALNVGADRQATVMLKRSDIPDQESQPQRTPPPKHSTKAKKRPVEPAESEAHPESAPAESMPAPVDSAILNRLDALEKALDEVRQMKSSDDSSEAVHSSEIANQFESRIHALETKLNEIQSDHEATIKMENRIASLEKRLKSLAELEERTNSRGFFARLFG